MVKKPMVKNHMAKKPMVKKPMAKMKKPAPTPTDRAQVVSRASD